MATTLSDLRTLCYAILREEENSSSYSYTLVDQLINSAQQRICSGIVVNPLTKEEVKKWQLPFLNTDAYYSSVKSTALDTATTVWATSLSVNDASEFDSSWYLYIGGNLITYTGTTATTFTGVTGVLFAFTAGENVTQAYALPSDYMNSINVIYNNKAQLDFKPYDDVFEYLNSIKGSFYGRNDSNSVYQSPYQIAPFYTIKDWAYIIIFNLDQADKMIKLRYEKVPTVMTLTTSTTAIDSDVYAKSVIPYLAVGETMYSRGEEARWAEVLNFWMGQLREMYSYYNKKTYEKPTGKAYRMWKWRLNI